MSGSGSGSGSGLDCPVEFARLRRRVKRKEKEAGKQWVRDKGIVEGVVKAFRKIRKRNPQKDYWWTPCFRFKSKTLYKELERSRCSITRGKIKKWSCPLFEFPSLRKKAGYMMNEIANALPDIYRLAGAQIERSKSENYMCTITAYFRLDEEKLKEYMDSLSSTTDVSSS